MIEIFPNISEDVRSKAAIIWKIAMAQGNPISAANYLNQVTNYYKTKWTEEEIDFLRFYFQTRMEMNNHD